MTDVDISYARSFLSDQEYGESLHKVEKAFQTVRKRTGPGAEWLGWQSLLADPNDAVLEQIDRLAAAIREDADVFIVCGIGGSYLGSRAVIDALSSFYGPAKPEILYAGHQMSGPYLQEILPYPEEPHADGKTNSG